MLGGARWLWLCSPLARGPCAHRGWCGWRGDAGEGAEAMGVDGRDEGQRLRAQRVGSVLAEQGDGGLLGGDEAGAQADCLHIRAPRQALAGPGLCFCFTDDHQLVGKVRLRLSHSHGVVWAGGGGGEKAKVCSALRCSAHTGTLCSRPEQRPREVWRGDDVLGE